MGIKQSHWPLWPLFHLDADPDDKRIALVPLLIGITLVFSQLPRKKMDYPALNWLYSYARTVSKMDGKGTVLPSPYLIFGFTIIFRSFSVSGGHNDSSYSLSLDWLSLLHYRWNAGFYLCPSEEKRSRLHYCRVARYSFS